MRLGVNPAEDGFGAQFDRPLSEADFKMLVRDMDRDIRNALFKGSFIEGSLLSEKPSGDKIHNETDQKVTTLVHGDSDIRFMLTPPGGRAEGTWIFHPGDRAPLLLAGMEFLLDSQALSAITNEHIKGERASVEKGFRPNKPWYPVAKDPGFTGELALACQRVFLELPNIRKKRIGWEEASPIKVVAMKFSLPHMREILSAESFISSGSTHRVDEYEGD